VNVPDERFDWLVEKHQPKSIVHPWLEICDIAGLVKGAAQVCVRVRVHVCFHCVCVSV